METAFQLIIQKSTNTKMLQFGKQT